MPSTIPYDPSLVLGNIVTKEALTNLDKISGLQAPVDNAESKLNDLIAMQRSMDMTIQELLNMQVDTTDLVKQRGDVSTAIQQAAIDFAQKKLQSVKAIQDLKGNKIQLIHDQIESPIDYNKSKITGLPLSVDSLKMNAQYFSFDENEQDSNTQANTVKTFISGELDYLGDSFKSQASAAVQSQMNSQYQKHSISGTLVVSVSCTHKNAQVFAPFILDVDKGIRAWNQLFPGNMLNISDPDSIAKSINQGAKEGEDTITLLSGATYGSCFIGMVHILNTTSTTASEVMTSVAASLQTQFSVAAFIANVSGGFGVDSSFSDDAKNLLSKQNVTSHCSLVTMGSIPSIKSNTVALGVKQFANFDGAGAMNQLAALQNATAADKDTVDSSATAARTGQQMIALKNAQVKGVLSGLADIDDKSNKMLDINSMMDALDDYIQKALGNIIGVPLNYYLKPITKPQLAQMWVNKYYPNKYIAVSGDDSQPTNNTSGNTAK
ncbi:hypothetical protein LX64_03112 [Chitinophaga skermanii]|uniref:Uncharacterized protein n=1 Tax=Chitinophaga skermanii TaxID=331697 RepID=A0A327QKK5_9BACT|nr:hypothetical protein [Chitinophaga skermanii]RAJ04232.1 hypothetical protein LX64_03112 [Chitinophaga skermanii]